GLSQKAVEIARPFGLPVTNSMVVMWIVAIGLILFARAATRTMKVVPEGSQNFLEFLIEGLYRFLEGIIGRHLVDRTFWFFASIFIFILAANWVGLIPGGGSIGWGHPTAVGFTIDEPLLRGANADVNMTLAMALVFFGCWIVWGLQENGPIGFLKELFSPKGESAGALKILMIVVFFAAGCLEIVSILFRPVSLTFRLYGNVFAGETMLETMARVHHIGWLGQIQFYFLELLVRERRKRWDAIPAPRRRSWSSRSWPSHSPKRSCSTPCSSSGRRRRARSHAGEAPVLDEYAAMNTLTLMVQSSAGGQVEEIAR